MIIKLLQWVMQILILQCYQNYCKSKTMAWLGERNVFIFKILHSRMFSFILVNYISPSDTHLVDQDTTKTEENPWSTAQTEFGIKTSQPFKKPKIGHV